MKLFSTLFTPLAAIGLLLSACSIHHPTEPDLKPGKTVRYVPSGFWTPQFTDEERANTLVDGFGAAYHPEDLRYQYAILQDARVQEQLHDLITTRPNGTSVTVHEFGNVALNVTTLSKSYYFRKAASRCRQLNVKWTVTTTGELLQEGPQIFCQIGGNLEWLPIN